MRVSILVIDHDPAACKRIKYTIQTELREVRCAFSIQKALQLLSRRPFTAVILNMARSQDKDLIEAMPHLASEPLAVFSCDVSAPRPSEARPPDGSSMLGSACAQETSLQRARELLQGCGR